MSAPSRPTLCECGCGKPAPIARQTRTSLGHVRGQAIRFISGHNGHRDPRQRWEEKVQRSDGCWLWVGAQDGHGYGSLSIDGIPRKAHRLAYQWFVGLIPDGLDLDHLCRNRACVNPDHLEAVSRAVNARRGMKAKLSIDDVRVIKKRLRSGDAVRVVAKEYAVSSGAINAIRAGHNWTDVSDELEPQS